MSFVTASQVSSLAVGLLSRTLVLPMTVARIPGTDFGGGHGDTITVRVPQPGSARKQSAGSSITYDQISETPVSVEMDHLYHATRISDEALSLDLVDFGQQVTTVQVDAVGRGAEDTIADEMNGLTPNQADVDPDDLEEEILKARRALSEADVPAGDRYMAVGPGVAAALLGIDKFVRVDQSGSETALREAQVGRLYGFTFVESNSLDSERAVAYHRTGFAMANFAPVAPRGASDSAAANKDGIALRQIFQYDPTVLSDASVVSTFAGASVVDPNRVYSFTLDFA